MTPELILFLFLALIAVGSAVAMITSRNAVHSALWLVLNFAVVAVFFLLLGAPFIAMVQVTVYAGAIMVLFLFVIMLLGAEMLRPDNTTLPWQRPLAFVLGIVFLGAVMAFIFLGWSNPTAPIGLVDDALRKFGAPNAIGKELFTRYLLPFELTSLLLLVAMVGAVVLVREDKKISNPKSQTSK